jgi:hypothetical protein
MDELLGTTNHIHFFVALVFAYIGALVSLLIHATSRDKDSARTPYKFDLGFLLSDNAKRVYLNAILLLLFVRFYPDITGGGEITFYIAVTTGVGVDKLLEFFRNKCVIDTPKQTGNTVNNNLNTTT